MKKILTIILMLTITLTALTSCGIINKVENAVTYTESYSITYEITTTEGLIYTITKTVDSDGNIYYKDINNEKLFIKDNDSYTFYQKNTDGNFEVENDAKYTIEAVEKELYVFNSYAQQTTDIFIPTARRTGESTVVGRTVDIYRIGVNLLAISFYHIYYVDQETGICLGVDVENKVFGNEVKDNEETFVCVSFDTENVEDLIKKIQ